MDATSPAPRPPRGPLGSRRRGREPSIKEQGYVLALTALLLIPLMTFTAFAVDVGQWYSQATEMQHAADAAALASVVWVGDKADNTKYITVGRQTAEKHGFKHNGTKNGATITVDVQRTDANRVKVTITANAMEFFGGFAKDTPETLKRSAAAEFNLSVPLGSPRNFLGTGDLGTASSGIYSDENIWLAISGRCTDAVQGDLRASQFLNKTNSNNCSGTQNPNFSAENYAYYIELPEGRTYDTDVLIYSGNMVNTQSNCEGSRGRTNEFCPGGLDSLPMMNTTFQLYQADDTPLDDTDNPKLATSNCKNVTGISNTGSKGNKTFAPWINSGPTPEFNTSFTIGTSISNINGWWHLCRIPSTDPAGRYIMRVRNSNTIDGALQNTNGSNAFSIVANRVGQTGFCDSRTDAMCPKVFAKDYLSVYAKADGTAQFFLAEIGPEHAGKRVRLTLFDSAEGAQNLRVQRPTGCTGNGTWAYQTFNWRENNGSWINNVSNIPVNSYDFNGDSVTIEFNLPNDYNPAACNRWYRVEYTYGSNATDRTTWAVEILGDPVHLVE